MSLVILASMNGYAAGQGEQDARAARPSARTAAARCGRHSLISQDGNRRVEPSRNIMYQSGCEPDDTCAGLYGPNSQTGLICAKPPSAAQHAEDDEEEAAGLGRVDREDPLAADRVLGAPGPRELGVLLPDDQRQVRADQREQDAPGSAARARCRAGR